MHSKSKSDVERDLAILARAMEIQSLGAMKGLGPSAIAALILADRLEQVLDVQFHNLAHKLTP